MQAILSCAVIAVLASSLMLVWRWGNLILIGQMPTKFFAFFSILFTSGLDVGLIMFPLTEFPIYEVEQAYGFTNPLAIVFGFWGFLIWVFYFLTTCYFCIIEPRVKIFERAWVKLVNNIIIIATCAFSGFLFLQYLPGYIVGITPVFRFALVALVVLAAVYSSTDIRYVKILSLSSTWLFFALIAAMWAFGGLGLSGLATNLFQIGDYFANIHRFVLPFSDYHAFYLFWWFAWSIMIGQFTARFVGGMRTYQVFLAMLIFPSIPIAIWFVGLYYYHLNELNISVWLNGLMVSVGILFVVNSLDSLIRLYTDNLNLTVKSIGKIPYFAANLLVLTGLTLLFTLDFLQIQWVGAIVIGLMFSCLLFILLTRFKLVTAISSSPEQNILDFAAVEAQK